MVFHDHVEVIYGPVDQPMDRVSRDYLIDQSGWLGCKVLTIQQHPQSEKNDQYLTMLATGNSQIEGKDFFGEAETISYDGSKALYVLRGDGNRMARLTRQFKPEVISKNNSNQILFKPSEGGSAGLDEKPRQGAVIRRRDVVVAVCCRVGRAERQCRDGSLRRRPVRSCAGAPFVGRHFDVHLSGRLERRRAGSRAVFALDRGLGRSTWRARRNPCRVAAQELGLARRARPSGFQCAAGLELLGLDRVRREPEPCSSPPAGSIVSKCIRGPTSG